MFVLMNIPFEPEHVWFGYCFHEGFYCNSWY